METRLRHNAATAVGVLFQSKWRVHILCVLCSGPVRLGELARLIPGASKKMLAQNLRYLEAAGIVVRRDMSDLVLHVEYDLATIPGLRVCTLLEQLAGWGELYLEAASTTRPEQK